MNAKFLHNFLSVATQNTVRFDIKYQNPCKGISRLLIFDPKVVEETAIKIFRQERPACRLENLATNLLTERAIDEFHSQRNKEEVILTNGCCTIEACPTTTFLGCVLKAIASYYT